MYGNFILKTYNATICHNTMKTYKDNVDSKLLNRDLRTNIWAQKGFKVQFRNI